MLFQERLFIKHAARLTKGLKNALFNQSLRRNKITFRYYYADSQFVNFYRSLYVGCNIPVTIL